MESDCLPFEFGKPVVRLPVINKKSGVLRFRYDNALDKSLDSKEKSMQNKTNNQRTEACLNM